MGFARNPTASRCKFCGTWARGSSGKRQPMLLRDDGGNRANWIEFEIAGTASNRSGIGARVKVIAGGLVQFDHVRAGGGYLSGNDLRLHFGLAGHKRADVEVRWPSGTLDRFENVEANRIWKLQEGKGISPSIYHGGPNRAPRKSAKPVT